MPVGEQPGFSMPGGAFAGVLGLVGGGQSQSQQFLGLLGTRTLAEDVIKTDRKSVV